MSHHAVGNSHDASVDGLAGNNVATDPNLWTHDRINQFQMHLHSDANGNVASNNNNNNNNNNNHASNLAVEAARYDPFKASELGNSSSAGGELANRARNPSTRGGFGYRSGPSFSAQKGMTGPFGQPGSPREISQPVSAMRTQDADSMDGQTQGASEGIEGDAASAGAGDSATRIANAAFERDGGVIGNSAPQMSSDANNTTADDGFHSPYGVPPPRVGDTSRTSSAAEGGRGEQLHDASLASMSGALDDEASSSFLQQDMSMKGASGKGGNKRKNFKYLQDESTSAVPSSSRGPEEKRKKVQKACRPCKRSHMPCQEQRPCPRCLKRGIPELCVDAEPIARRPRKESDRPQEQEQADQQQSHQLPSQLQRPQFGYTEDEGIADIHQLAKAAHAAASSSVGAVRSPPLYGDLSDETGSQQPQQPRPRASDVFTQPIEIETFQASLLPSSEDLLDKYGYLSFAMLADSETDPAVPYYQEAADFAGEAKPNKFSWTRSYADLARWADRALPSKTAAQLDNILTSQRCQLTQEGASLTTELQSLEAASISGMQDMARNVLENIPVPMMLLRRSGEIYAQNTHALHAFSSLDPSVGNNLIKFGHDDHALIIADLIATVTTADASTNVPISRPVNLVTGGGEAEVTGIATYRKFILTLEAKKYAMEGSISGETRLPLFVTCVLTPIDGSTIGRSIAVR